jgi:hypothetical protein
VKVHLLDTNEPMREGEDVKANCGAVIPGARAAFMWDGEVVGDDFVLDGPFKAKLCRKCLDIEDPPGTPLQRYAYGIVSGEEAMQECSA